MGVRPILDCCAVDAEKARRGAGVLPMSAGTRNDGRVAIGEEQSATLDLLGASMVGGGRGMSAAAAPLRSTA